MKAWAISLLICSMYPAHAWQSAVVSTNQKDTDQSRIASISSILTEADASHSEKFQQVLSKSLQLEGYRSGGPDTLFSKVPLWSTYLLIYSNRYEVCSALIPEYKNADLSFLTLWVKHKGPSKLTTFMTELGYFAKDGRAKNRKITPAHQRQILQFAVAIYNAPIPAS